MYKKIRISAAIISFLAMIALFVDFTGTARHWWGWLAKIQFIPALLSLSIIGLAFVILLTVVFGRIYCSVICPLGIFQDFINRLRSSFGPKKTRRNRFNYKQAATKLRIAILALFAILFVLGLTNVLAAAVAGLIEPYSAFGRMANAFAVPVVDAINNYITENTTSYTFTYVYHTTSTLILIVAAITLIVVTVFAWLTGRDYCNKICPVGTILGYLSRIAILRPVIDTTKCNGCSKCARNCKASCINASAHTIDYTRCVACMDCIDNCAQGAISYTTRKPAVKTPEESADYKSDVDSSRRAFLTTSGIIVGALALKAADKTTDGGLTPLLDKPKRERATRVLPPGALSISNLTAHCTGCQLCVSACPESVLTPSTSFDSLMQPEMSFNKGYCRPECNACSQACPTGAIEPIDIIEKCSTRIGLARVDASICLSAAEGIKCGNCARHCPAEAIIMVETNGEGSNLRPAVDESRCIGCGSCEYHCPVGRVEGTPANQSAIYVEGIEIQHTI